MMSDDLSPDDAARALSEVAQRRRQVAEAADPVPGWYFPMYGVLVAVFFALLDHPTSPAYWPATVLVQVVGFGLGWLARRRQLVKPHQSLYGVRGWAVIAVAMVVFFVVAMATNELVLRSDIQRPHTATGVVIGVLLAGVGPLLRHWLRRAFVRRAGEAAR